MYIFPQLLFSIPILAAWPDQPWDAWYVYRTPVVLHFEADELVSWNEPLPQVHQRHPLASSGGGNSFQDTFTNPIQDAQDTFQDQFDRQLEQGQRQFQQQQQQMQRQRDSQHHKFGHTHHHGHD